MGTNLYHTWFKGLIYSYLYLIFMFIYYYFKSSLLLSILRLYDEHKHVICIITILKQTLPQVPPPLIYFDVRGYFAKF